MLLIVPPNKKSDAAFWIIRPAFPVKRPCGVRVEPDSPRVSVRADDVVERNHLGEVSALETRAEIQHRLGAVGRVLDVFEAERNEPVAGIHRDGHAGFVLGCENEIAILRLGGNEWDGFLLSPRAGREVKAWTEIVREEQVCAVADRVGERLALGGEHEGDIPALDRLRAGPALAGIGSGDLRRRGGLAGSEEQKPGGAEQEEWVFDHSCCFEWLEILWIDFSFGRRLSISGL